ncbi:hypothetical protein CDAR_502711 [Caerostris darwini]|uniref:Granulins domain-containing protein n=2 Tax=Caerostris darwini TaxID=1538125 RepID=A0AAV4S6J5_9ARAC|nr:hypothetical protein CDAR_502711 [Caerostris darwini]
MMSSEPGVPLPEYRVLSQKLNETGIEMCEDMLHLCPATADCCKKDDGKWDCCPKQAAIGGNVKSLSPRNQFCVAKKPIELASSSNKLFSNGKRLNLYIHKTKVRRTRFIPLEAIIIE